MVYAQNRYHNPQEGSAACPLTVESQKCMKDRGHCDTGLIHVQSADEWGHHTVDMALSLDRGGP